MNKQVGAVSVAGASEAQPEIKEQARKHLVQPWPVAGGLGETAHMLVSASEAIYIYDEQGRKLIDGPGGMWCVQVGHRREELAQVLYDQSMAMTYSSPWYTTSGPAAELAAVIADRAPGDLDHVFFSTGGSTAVETAIRLAWFYHAVRGKPHKTKLLTREGAYHGSTFLTGSICGKPRDRDWMTQFDDQVIRLSSPATLRRPDDMSIEAFGDHLVAEAEQRIAEAGPDTIAAFVGEPIMASGGVIVPPEGYLGRMRELCRKHDILFIMDEVVTAFGRLGHIFASGDVFGLDPDMITFAKGVTSGYFPLGGTVISSALVDEIKQSGQDSAMFAHGYTYSSHPVGCALALKNIAIMEDGLLQHTRALTPYFQKRLKELESLDLVGEVRGMGLMAGIECVADRTSKNPLALDLEVGARIDTHCQELGLLVRPLINMIVMSPPLIIEKPEIDRMVEILHEGISRTMVDLKKEGLWSGA
ncbi:MAG: aminotransferase [Pseudomonadota bacterium]